MTSSGYNLQSVILKEIGHVLGIPDFPYPSAVVSSGYSYCTDLTGYDLYYLYYFYPNSFPGSLTGPKLINTYGTYQISNFPSGLTTSWYLSNSYYNDPSHLVSNSPVPGYCLVFRNNSHDMMNDSLTATVLKDNIVVKTLTKSGIYAYADFWGQYTSGSLSGDINYSHSFGVKANTATTVTSPNFYGATVTYDSSSGVTPTAWGFHPTNGLLNFTAPSGNVPVVINVHDGCGNDYTLYAFVSSKCGMNVTCGEDGSITVTLVEDGDASKDFTPEEPWTLEITSATTGRVMVKQSSTSRSETISTAGWPKGIYVVKVTIGKEVLTEKVMVK